MSLIKHRRISRCHLWATAQIAACLTALTLAVAAPVASAPQKDPPTGKDKGHKPRFTIGKDTTFVLGPVDKDGYVDYVRAVNDRLRQGVTLDNNAAVLLWAAFGPRPDGEALRSEFFESLGIAAPAEKGDYFVHFDRYLSHDTALSAEQRHDLSTDLSDRAAQRPWTAKLYPHIAAWLQANEKPLDLCVAAAKRSHYYAPMVHGKDKDADAGLVVSVVLPTGPMCFRVARALAARAMLRVGERRYSEAWQ